MDGRPMVAPTVKLGLTQGPFREGAVTEGDWGSMRERVICCCDMAVEERLQKTPSVICFANATSLKREAL